MNKKIVIAGGTGFVGHYLASQWKNAYDSVIIISRKKGDVLWSNFDDVVKALEGADILINMSGRSVDCRYNEKNKREIFDSRIDTTKILGNAVSSCVKPPKLWINSSTATIYRHAEDRPMTEADGIIGKGFSVDVATNWEKAFFDFKLEHTRQIALRIAIVLGKEGGAIKPLKNLVRLGLGGKQGNGKQMFSWIHIEDLYSIILFLEGNKNLNGVFNVSSPNPINNKTFMQVFRHKMNATIGLPSPEWLLKIGAMLINTETELILKSRWVLPERLLQSGYNFKYKKIDTALDEVLS